MNIEKIYLANFRSFTERLFEFSNDTTVIVGDNASGKTNVLEAISLLATGKSFKAKIEQEMVHYDAELGRVKGKIIDNEESKKLEVVLTRGMIRVSDNPDKYEKIAKKKMLVNGVSRRLVDFSGHLQVVLFAPQDLDLVTESPSIRRKFLNTVLSQIDREYRRSLLSYEKGVRQRNKLLLRIREEGLPRSQLIFWDSILIKNGDYLSRVRQEFIDYVNKTKPMDDRVFRLEYGKSAISEERLAQYAHEEVYAGKTLVGPHRDDFKFSIINDQLSKDKKRGDSDVLRNSRDLSTYGSRGEQRMGVLWLKLSELSFIEKKVGERPILLLDDIFSELDHEHRDIVMEVVRDQQTVITTADPHFVEGFEGGSIVELGEN